MPTTRQMAKIAGISEQTVRNYTRDYAELLSPKARGEVGNRLFNDKDVQTICTIATLRDEGVPQAEIIERLRKGDIVVDVEPQQATTSPQTALDAGYSLALAHHEIREIKRTQRLLLRAAALWGALLGAIVALVAAGFVVWVLWLTGR